MNVLRLLGKDTKKIAQFTSRSRNLRGRTPNSGAFIGRHYANKWECLWRGDNAGKAQKKKGRLAPTTAHLGHRANKKAENQSFPPCNVPVCVGETGFEPATSNSRSWRANRTALHPELKCGANIQLISISCSKKSGQMRNNPLFTTKKATNPRGIRRQ